MYITNKGIVSIDGQEQHNFDTILTIRFNFDYYYFLSFFLKNLF